VIGDDVIIGAGSVVLHNVENNSKLVGNPGRLLK
jgi:serine acetyltransferase